MKKYIYTIIATIVAISLSINILSVNKIKTLNSSVEQLRSVEWAYERENSELKDKSIQATYTIAMLNNSNDSLVTKLNEARRQLRVKDKELRNLAYIASTAHIKDTIHTRDTIFVENTKVDTTIHNKWYDMNLQLEYPDRIQTDLSVKSQKYIVSSVQKVTVNPSKCWLVNLFKKKQNIVEVEVVEENPYITSDKQKFIQVVQ